MAEEGISWLVLCMPSFWLVRFVKRDFHGFGKWFVRAWHDFHGFEVCGCSVQMFGCLEVHSLGCWGLRFSFWEDWGVRL